MTTSTHTNLTNKQFLKSFAIIAVPIIFQQFVTISLNLIDNLMVGQLGIVAIASVGFANKVYFIYILTIFGTCAGFGIFISQYFGKKDYDMIRKIAALMLLLSLFIAIIFAIISVLAPAFIIGIFTKEPDVLQNGVQYLQIIGLTFPFGAISLAVTTALRSMGITKQALYITVVVTTINTILNYMLIYGNLGFPRLEVQGAAIATLIARIIETLCFIYLIFRPQYHLTTKLKNYFGLKIETVKSIIRVSIPIFFTEFLWVVGTTTLSVAYSKLGTQAAAATQIADNLLSVSTILFLGIASASSVLIGQAIGFGDMPKAFKISTKVIYLSICMAFATILISLMLVKPILYAFALEGEMYDITQKILVVMSFALFFKMINWAVLIGILRAGGDTTIAFLIDVVLLAFYAVPIAFILALFTSTPIYLIVLFVNLEEVLKMLVATWRYKSKKWMRDLTKIEKGTN